MDYVLEVTQQDRAPDIANIPFSRVTGLSFKL